MGKVVYAEGKNRGYTRQYPTKIGLAVNKARGQQGASLKILNPLSRLQRPPFKVVKVYPTNNLKIRRK